MSRNWLYQYELDWSKGTREDKALTKATKLKMKKERDKYNMKLPPQILAPPSTLDESNSGFASSPLLTDSPPKKMIYRDLVPLKEKSLENIERINKVFNNANNSIHPVLTGVGSKGGHIARELKSPGPLNGHNVILPKDRLAFFHGATPAAHPRTYHLVELPVWNDRFITQKSLSVDPFERAVTPIRSNSINVKRDIQEYLSLSKSLYSIDNHSSTSNTNNSTNTNTNKITQRTMNTYYNDPNNSLFNDNVFPLESDEEDEQDDRKGRAGGGGSGSTVAYPSTMVRSAEKLWKRMVVDLKCEAMRIHYVDLVEIARIQTPCDIIKHIIGYICLLLGISPTWESAKRYLFKECIPLLKFLHEVCIYNNYIY